MKTSLRKFLFQSYKRMFAVAAFFMILGFVQPVQSGNLGEKSHDQTSNLVDQTPMYADPKYVNSFMNDATTNNNQKAPGGPPPPGDPVPNETPVPSGILSLLAMAFTLTFWRVRIQLRKTKK